MGIQIGDSDSDHDQYNDELLIDSDSEDLEKIILNTETDSLLTILDENSLNESFDDFINSIDIPIEVRKTDNVELMSDSKRRSCIKEREGRAVELQQQ